MNSIRRVAQVLFLAVWAVAFVRACQTAACAAGPLALPEPFLRTDPLAGILSSAAARAFAHELVYWLPLLLLPLVLGRAFCGWACPLGTLLDIRDHAVLRLWGRRGEHLKTNCAGHTPAPHWPKYALLCAGMGAALLGVSLLGHLDPLCLLTRAAAFSVAPALAELQQMVAGTLSLADRDAAARHFYVAGLWSAVLCAGVLTLNKAARRYWCRTLCPLGALLGTCSRFSVLALAVDRDTCTACGHCSRICKTGAIPFEPSMQKVTTCLKSECIVCGACVDRCPAGALSFRLSTRLASQRLSAACDAPTVPAVSRRAVVGSLAGGACVALLARVNPVARATENLHLIRPPGSRSNEREFLSLCARCGMCVQVCRTNTLQPATLLSGLETAMTPVLTPEIAGCDPCCTACGQVCPTNAIAPFSAESKLRVKLGTAKIERDRCIGWTEGTECNECAVICPTLAIKAARIAGVIRPVRVSFAECTGCGMCVQRCNQIVANSAACVVSAKGRGLATDIAAVSKQRQERAAISPRHFPVIDIPPGELS